jgi:hypothetical protein
MMSYGYPGSLFKETRYENPGLREAARGQHCMNCGREDGTVVGAHSNDSALGKGSWLKSHDIFIAWLCHACHLYVDNAARSEPTGRYENNNEDRKECHTRAMLKTILALARLGWIKRSV